MKWLLAPLATAIAVAIGYAIYSNERANTPNPLTAWFGAEDSTDYQPTAWDQAIGKNPRRGNA